MRYPESNSLLRVLTVFAGLLLIGLSVGGCDSGNGNGDGNGSGAGSRAGSGGQSGSGSDAAIAPGAGSGSGSGGATGSDAAAGTDAAPPDETPIGGPSTWDPPLEIPRLWEPPAECGSLGEPCQAGGCEGDAICNYDISVCAPPRLNPLNNFGCDNDCPREYPYCLHYACMTLEEASCFCTGSLGSQDEKCSGGPAYALDMCEGEGASCSQDSDCCGMYSCTEISPGTSRCYQACFGPEECETACCTDYHDIGTAICAPVEECENPCKKQGEVCEDRSECCQGTCVTGTDNPDWLGCRPSCNQDEDCFTGCCQLYSNATYGFCVVAKYCGCGAEGVLCGPYEPACCDGLECTSTDVEGEYTCKPRCQEDTDCASNCCVPITGTDFSVCYDSSYCGY